MQISYVLATLAAIIICCAGAWWAYQAYPVRGGLFGADSAEGSSTVATSTISAQQKAINATTQSFFSSWIAVSSVSEKVGILQSEKDLLTSAFSRKFTVILNTVRPSVDPVVCTRANPTNITISDMHADTAFTGSALVHEDLASGDSLIVKALLAQQGGAWKIDDIVCPTAH